MTKPKRRLQRRTSKINPLGARIGRAVGGNDTPLTSVETPPAPPKPPKPTPPPSAPPPLPLSEIDTHGTPKDAAGVSPIASAGGADASSTYSPSSTYSIRLRLRGSLVSKYASAAARRVVDLEDVMEGVLTRSADRLDIDTPLTFTDDQRRSIIDALGSADPESVVRHIQNLVSASALDTSTSTSAPVSTLRFSAQQLERVSSRCASGESLESKLQEYSDYGINLQTGLA